MDTNYYMFLNLDNPGWIFISNNENNTISIARAATNNNIKYWLNRCTKFFIYENDKISEKEEISRADALSYLSN